MPSLIQARMASSAEMLALFEDRALIANALRFEAALAQAEAECGVIPPSAARAIAEAARQAADIDAAALAAAAAQGGTFAIPLVKELGRRVAAIDPEAAGFVHF